MSTTLKLDLSRQLEPEEKIKYSTNPLTLINSSLPIYKQAESFRPELAYKSQIIKAGSKSKHAPTSLNLEFIKSADELGTMREHRDLMTPLKDVRQEQLEPSFQMMMRAELEGQKKDNDNIFVQVAQNIDPHVRKSLNTLES